MAATYLLPNAVGEANARELLLTGRTVEAEEARQLGLVSRVFAADDFAGQVDEIAAGIAATAPIPSRYTKVALRDGGHQDFESCVQWEALAQPITLATADLQEGIARSEGEASSAVRRRLSSVRARTAGRVQHVWSRISSTLGIRPLTRSVFSRYPWAPASRAPWPAVSNG